MKQGGRAAAVVVGTRTVTAANGRPAARAAGAGREQAGWLAAVRQVISAVRASDVTELELVSGDFAVRVRREPGLAPAAPAATATVEPADDPLLHRVVAPFTGVFYRSPTPSAGAYVDEGEWVDADAVIGLVETMKIFNEIKTDVAGCIRRFMADNGQLVHTGDPLVAIEPGERTTAEPEPRV